MTLISSSIDNTAIIFDEGINESIRIKTLDLLAEWGLPKAEKLTVTPLSGGASNTNLKLDSGVEAWHMRICANDPDRWGVDRKAAIIAQQDAAALGFAPPILASTLPEGHYLAE